VCFGGEGEDPPRSRDNNPSAPHDEHDGGSDSVGGRGAEVSADDPPFGVQLLKMVVVVDADCREEGGETREVWEAVKEEDVGDAVRVRPRVALCDVGHRGVFPVGPWCICR
jgi:hypothetical protein